MVRLKGFYPCSRRETDMPAALLRGKVLIGPGITALKPEAGRSIPEQDEVALTSDGGWSEWRGVSLCPERETTQTMVKAPKYWISVRESLAQDNGKVGLEAATL